MGLFTLSVDKNFAWDLMDSLGKLACLQFVDVNGIEQTYNRPYNAIIRRCDEALQKIKNIELLCGTYNKKLKQPSSIDFFQANLQQSIASQGLGPMAYFEKIESSIEEAEKFFRQRQEEGKQFYTRYLSVVQHRYVLNKASEIVLARAR